jgi:hypothetical protein
MIQFLVPREQDFAIRDFLAGGGIQLEPRVAVVHYEDVAAARSLPRGSYVLTALDQLHPATLHAVARLGDRLTADALPLLNDPRRTLLRLDLLTALHREGINRHRAFPATAVPDDLVFPVFLREEHRHTGAQSGLIQDRKELSQSVAVARAQGHRLVDLLVVEFFDSRDAQGYYRKYSAFVVGPHIIPRGLSYGKTWMLKARDTEFSAAMLAEEFEFMQANPHREALRRIADIGAVGYGRIDYAVRDGRVEVWEINLNPTIGRGRGTKSTMTPEIRAMREPTRALWTRGLVSALEGFDTAPAAPGRIPLPAPFPLPVGQPVLRIGRGPAREGLLRVLLRPFKPVLLPLVRALSPLLLRLVRPRG